MTEQLREVNKALESLNIEDIESIIVIKKKGTNGDMLKAMFPSIDARKKAFEMELNVNKNKVGDVSINWWNAPYK